MALDSAVQRSTEVALQMLSEKRYAEACLFLFHLNKLHPEEWKTVCSNLMSEVDLGNGLAALATIINCSARSDLSSCDAMISGLSQYSRRLQSPEILD